MTILQGVHDTIGLLGLCFFGAVLLGAGLALLEVWLGRGPKRGRREIY